MKKLSVLLFLSQRELGLAQTANPPPPKALSGGADHRYGEKLIEKNPKTSRPITLWLWRSRAARAKPLTLLSTRRAKMRSEVLCNLPGQFRWSEIQVWLLLGRHEFAAALEEAKKLNKKMPDDVMLYGFLTDANVELGNYKDAENAAQLDARPQSLETCRP